MSRKAVLSVALNDVEGRVVSSARVDLGGRALSFDERLGAYVGEPAEPGEYTLSVYAEGYEAQYVTLQLPPQGLSTSLILGRAGQPYYVAAGRRIYFEPERARAAEAMPRDPRMAGLPALGEGRFLSRQIAVIVEEGVAREELEKAIRPHRLRVRSQNGTDPRRFRVETERDLPLEELGALPERLAELPEVRSAHSIVTAIDPDTQVLPADGLFPMQFHHFLVRLPEAWHFLNSAGTGTSFGSADVIVAVSDSGILTTGTPPAPQVPTQPEFGGLVTGGALAGQPGLNSNRLIFTFNFDTLPMRAGPHTPLTPHGSAVAGIISARADGVGVVGVAANTRLAAYIREAESHSLRAANALIFAAGLDPRWTQTAPDYDPAEPFPFLFGTGANPIPGAHILNNSHAFVADISTDVAPALQRMTLFGRDRRGTLIFVASGNDDRDLRPNARWAENTNVMQVTASTLDHRERETRASYSNSSVITDPVLDFCAPSESQNTSPRTFDHIPFIYPFFTTAPDSPAGPAPDHLPGGVFRRFPITNSPARGTRTITANAADLNGLGPGTGFCIRDRRNLHAELHEIATIGTGTLNTARDLGFSYTHTDTELILLTTPFGGTFNFGGTSAACPIAAGVAALVISEKPALTWLEVRDILRSTAVPIDLRYRGFGPAHRYRWLDPVLISLIDADGLLDIVRGNKTITAAARRGDRFLTLNDTTDVVPRRALLIGVETTLTAPLPKPLFDRQLDVARPDDFEIGDTIFTGRDVETVLITPAAAGDTVVWVQSTDGFQVGTDIMVDTEPATIAGLRRMTDAPALPQRIDDAECGLILTTGLVNPHARAEIVRFIFRDGPFTITGKTGNTLEVHRAIVTTQPIGSIVEKEGTEIKAVVKVHSATRVEIDPLHFDHPLSASGVEHVRLGRIADFGLGFGRGRVDARAAVEAARAFTHDLRDLVVRNFLADDGVNNRGTQEVESPDLWVRNRTQDTITTFPNYTDAGPHEVPEITVDPAIHIGTGRNDLEVSGTCTSAAEVTFTIEIDQTATPDTFKFRKDNGAPTTGVAITGAAQALSDGVSIRFAATTGHVLGDKWIVKGRQITSRNLHLRVRNRGTLPFFEESQFAPAVSPDILNVARARILLCVTDGMPVCRFASVADSQGTDDLTVVSPYTGPAPRALYTIEMTAGDPDPNRFRWFRDGTAHPEVTLTATTLEQTLDGGVRVRFGSHTGHRAGDRWNIFARFGPGMDPYLNLDHYPEVTAPAGFNPSSGRTGTVEMLPPAISGLGAGAANIFVGGWAENFRFPTNNPNVPKPTVRRRLFFLGEVVPHDGKLAGPTTKTNNNFSFRELIFAKIRFSTNAGADPLEAQLDVPNLGQSIPKSFRVEVRCTAGTFTAERVRLKLTARKDPAPPEEKTFRFSGTWGWDGTPPTWVTVAPPLEARRPDGTQPATPATGEQFDISFECSLTVNKSFSDVVIEAQILSDFRDLAIFKATHSIAIFAIAPLPTGTGAASAATQPKPSSFVFTEMATLTQTVSQAFGPVDGSLTTRYRTTSIFHAPGDVKAFATVTGFVALQRDPTNNDAVNLILRPYEQPLAGFTPIKYFIYRGLRLTDFLKGTSGPDAELIRPQAGASPFLDVVWTIFLAHNPGATDMPAALFGYEPATQTATDSLDGVFFRTGAPMQLPLATRGIELGSFHAGGGGADFGFEIVIDEGDFTHDLAFARAAANVIDISGMPTTTAGDKLARSTKQEEILGYLDPAAFYGLHMHDDGEVEIPGGVTLDGEGIFVEVVSKFFTKHALYLDVRSENGASLNFYGNYNDGAGNQIRTSPVLGPVTARPYATHGWPIAILDQSAPQNIVGPLSDLFLELPREDNVNPVLYIDHGIAGMPTTDGPFVRDSQLVFTSAQWTKTLQFGFANTGPDGARQGVAWVIRLFYGRLLHPAPTVPIPDIVLKTETYTDNVFGPIDRAPRWAGTAAIKWETIQDNRYVDAAGEPALGWRQMMRCGLAEQTGGTPRVLLFAVATDRDTTQPGEFAPVRSIPAGISSRSSFFDEPGLFGVYQLEHDQIVDAGTTVRTLRLRQRPSDGYSPTSAMLLGLTKVEFDALVARGGSMSHHFRAMKLDEKQSLVDPNGRPFDRYRVGIQGLSVNNAEHTTDLPFDEIRVYTVDGQLFVSKAFADAEPLPTVYVRSFEEAMGVRVWPQRERRIAAVDVATRQITIASFDWRREVVPGLKMKIDKSAAQNGEYIVDTITLSGADSVIRFTAGTLSATAPLGSAFTPQRPVEDVFIDLDQDGAVAGIPKTRTLVDTFATDLAAIPNNAAAKTAIETRVNDAAPKLLQRARERAAADRTRADDHERTLYWARMRMLVALKSHPFCLASIAARNELVALLEKKSRGYDLTFSGAPGGAKKILVTGFDPFQLDLGIETSNPSAATALAFHGRTITSSGKSAYLESAIFPVRYRDFDAGAVEDLVNPRLGGAGQVDLIITISQNGGSSAFDVERLAGRRRGGFFDNEHVTSPPRQLGVNTTHPAFLETTLPVLQFVPGPFTSPPDDDQRVFFDQSFETELPAQSFAEASDPSSPAGANANTPAFALNTITGQAVDGSGGSYLSNEIFYRVAQRRVTLASTTLTGHVHIPSPSNAKMGIADVIGEVENMIKRFLDSLP